MKSSLCINCNQNLTKKYRSKKYCSYKCMWKYRNKKQYEENKQYFKYKSTNWAKQNPRKRREQVKKAVDKFRKEKKEQFYKSMKEYRQRNKNKIQSRWKTLMYVGKYNLFPDRICKLCSSIIKIELHHEIYPTKKKDILQAIQDKKIYLVCKECHELNLH